ncbi:V-type ATP synthase alpha chain [bioreactor metagenome]|uniref:V-type ATP synthase alpha chain n=1 Tax=bioreactor metagenome TaxID=1076179 RepID=A0A645DBC9_9ZZZZ
MDRQLAYARHYPAINWLTSYSEYAEELKGWFDSNVDKTFYENRADIISILQTESKLMEIVNLIGSDVLPDDQKLLLEIARTIRLGFLQQNAYHENDTYVPIVKQHKMAAIILFLYDKTKELLPLNIPISIIKETGLFEKIIRIKYDIKNDQLSLFDTYRSDIEKTVADIKARYKTEEKRSNPV